MYRIAITVALMTAAAAGPASPQSIGEVLEAFGLLGTWSPDCSDKKSQPRLTFAGGGNPTASFSNPANNESGESNVTAAERVSMEKVSVTVVPTKRNGKSIEAGSTDRRPHTMVIEKVGNRIKGPNGPIFENCRN